MECDECARFLWMGDKELCTGKVPFGALKFFLCPLEISKGPEAATVDNGCA